MGKPDRAHIKTTLISFKEKNTRQPCDKGIQSFRYFDKRLVIWVKGFCIEPVCWLLSQLLLYQNWSRKVNVLGKTRYEHYFLTLFNKGVQKKDCTQSLNFCYPLSLALHRLATATLSLSPTITSFFFLTPSPSLPHRSTFSQLLGRLAQGMCLEYVHITLMNHSDYSYMCRSETWHDTHMHTLIQIHVEQLLYLNSLTFH